MTRQTKSKSLCRNKSVANIKTRDALEAARQLAARAEVLLDRHSRDPRLREFAEREAAVCSRLAEMLIVSVEAQ